MNAPGPVNGNRANRTVVFIGGAPHSGSTLLGLVLGAHPEVVYGGELRKSAFLGDESRPLKKRVCKLCGPACPVWGELRQPLDADVYETLSRRTGRPIVVDSSKSTEWQGQQIAALADAGVRTTLIYLRRDGRAILASRMRKYPDLAARRIALDWVAQIEKTDARVGSFGGEVIDVRYEELATEPERVVRMVCARLALAFDAAMLRFWEADPHPLGGNDGTQFLVARERARRATGAPSPATDVLDLGERGRAYYGAHPAAIVLDLRWQRELSPEALSTFDEVAAETNRRFAWPAPVDGPSANGGAPPEPTRAGGTP